MPRLARLVVIASLGCCFSLTATTLVGQEKPGVGPRTLWRQSFYEAHGADYGRTPPAWKDLRPFGPNPGWIIDARSLLRFVQKGRTGLIAYHGGSRTGQWIGELDDGIVSTTFFKTPDDAVSVGIACRIVDANNFYLARFNGDHRFELLKVVEGKEIPLDVVPTADGSPMRTPGLTTLRRYLNNEYWKISLKFQGDELTAQLEHYVYGEPQGMLTAHDKQFQKGAVGFCCTPYVGLTSISVESPLDLPPKSQRIPTERIEARNRSRSQPSFDVDERKYLYPIVRPRTFDEPGTLLPDAVQVKWSPADAGIEPPPSWSLPPERIGEKYDVVVAGAGTGGWAAAVQAARLGARVLLLEETDWIGGQMCAAGVTTMDEDGVRGTYAVRERGLYREFHESMVAYYHSRDKDPFVAYYGWPEQREGGYEPKVARGVLYGFIDEVRKHGAVLDVVLQARVAEVRKEADRVVGVKLLFRRRDANWESIEQEREVGCKVLIDATEYGDVIPLTGARYRVGNTTNDKPDPKSLVQDYTWTAILEAYPNNLKRELQILTPPPGYAEHAGKRFRKYQNEGPIIWGAAGKGIKGPRSWRSYFAWRGMADSESALVGEMSSSRHTQCGFNGGNDYPVTAATIEDPEQRLRDEREGIYRTLGTLYYFQKELGVSWSLAENEGYDTDYNQWKMQQLGLSEDLRRLAVHLPQQPYVRESRRIMGVKTLIAADLGRYENAKLFPTSIAMGDYFMDLDHGKTAHAIEADLDGPLFAAGGVPPHGGGPFQVPFEVLVPEKIDGFLAAEKNISQSRLVNGATRLQPITMLTGQAAGATAALAALRGVQPRALRSLEVQSALLDAGSTLVQRWYADVPWRSTYWKSTQLVALHGIFDRPMQIDDDPATPLGAEARYGLDQPITPDELRTALIRLAALRGLPTPKVEIPTDAKTITFDEGLKQIGLIHFAWEQSAANAIDGRRGEYMTAGPFAIACAQILLLPPDAETKDQE